MPEGEAEAAVTCEGKTTHFSGTGHHDHNRGNIPMNILMHHWHWGARKSAAIRSSAPYITAQKKYGYTHSPSFCSPRAGSSSISGAATKLLPVVWKPAFSSLSGSRWADARPT